MTNKPTSFNYADYVQIKHDLATMTKQFNEVNDGLNDLMNNGFCGSCGQKRCNFRNHENTYCPEWEYRGATEQKGVGDKWLK